MNMNKKLAGGLAGLTALLMSSVINAATVQLTPDTQTVTVGDPLSIAVEGVDFFNDVEGGGVNITWDPSQVSLVTSAQVVNDSLVALGFETIFNVDIVAGSLDTTFFSFIGTVPGPDFTLFTLDFLAAPLPSTANLAIGISADAGGWTDGSGTPIAVGYAGATVTVEAVPVPAAVWLFGSGLIGLVGVARRKTQLA